MVKKYQVALSALMLVLSGQPYAAAPCDFKGVSVGDKIQVPDLMRSLGITQYAINPPVPDFAAQQLLMDKYGMTGASEIQDYKTGPYCTKYSCRIPYGIKVGIDIPASISVIFDENTHQVQAIDIAINSIHWDDFVKIIQRKYGKDWTIEKMPISIMDYKTKHWSTFQREILTHKKGGINPKTNDECEISGTNYDMIFMHNDPLGAYHSIFEIKLISTNF